MSNIITTGSMLAGQARSFVNKKLFSKMSADETLIVKIILMVIAVALCLIFRSAIASTITSLVESVQVSITNMLNSTNTGSASGGGIQ